MDNAFFDVQYFIEYTSHPDLTFSSKIKTLLILWFSVFCVFRHIVWIHLKPSKIISSVFPSGANTYSSCCNFKWLLEPFFLCFDFHSIHTLKGYNMQKNNRLTINFFTRKHKVQSENRIVYCRITIDGERTDFSINREIKTNLWDNSRKRGKGFSNYVISSCPSASRAPPR